MFQIKKFLLCLVSLSSVSCFNPDGDVWPSAPNPVPPPQEIERAGQIRQQFISGNNLNQGFPQTSGASSGFNNPTITSCRQVADCINNIVQSNRNGNAASGQFEQQLRAATQQLTRRPNPPPRCTQTTLDNFVRRSIDLNNLKHLRYKQLGECVLRNNNAGIGFSPCSIPPNNELTSACYNTGSGAVNTGLNSGFNSGINPLINPLNNGFLNSGTNPLSQLGRRRRKRFNNLGLPNNRVPNSFPGVNSNAYNPMVDYESNGAFQGVAQCLNTCACPHIEYCFQCYQTEPLGAVHRDIHRAESDLTRHRHDCAIPLAVFALGSSLVG